MSGQADTEAVARGGELLNSQSKGCRVFEVSQNSQVLKLSPGRGCSRSFRFETHAVAAVVAGLKLMRLQP